MAFSNTVTDIVPFANGLIMEYGTFNGATVTSGEITASTASTYTVGDSHITEIISWGFASDGDTAIIPAKDVAPNKIKITFTANDTGDYWIIGKAR